MQWSNFVCEVEHADGRRSVGTYRAVSVKHALTKIQKRYPAAKQWEVEKCRCSEVNNDICSACYRLTY